MIYVISVTWNRSFICVSLFSELTIIQYIQLFCLVLTPTTTLPLPPSTHTGNYMYYICYLEEILHLCESVLKLDHRPVCTAVELGVGHLDHCLHLVTLNHIFTGKRLQQQHRLISITPATATTKYVMNVMKKLLTLTYTLKDVNTQVQRAEYQSFNFQTCYLTKKKFPCWHKIIIPPKCSKLY